MNKDAIKKMLDYTPLLILVVYAVVLIWTVSTTDLAFTWRNVVAVIIIPINCLAFLLRHHVGVLCLGLVLTLGLFGMLSYTPGLTRTTLSFGFGESVIEFWAQPVFLMWIVVHFILSGRYYVGILTEGYWRRLISK